MAEQQVTTSVEVPPAHEAEPTALGLNPGGWVALAMLAVFAILIWKKVPGAIGRALDSKIALIRDQLAEAEALRKEAEALKGEYEAKAASADKDRAALLERAKHEADDSAKPLLLVDDGQAADLRLAHLVGDLLDVLVDTRADDVVGHEVAHRRVRTIALRHAAHGDVAVGDHAEQPLALDHWDRAGV